MSMCYHASPERQVLALVVALYNPGKGTHLKVNIYNISQVHHSMKGYINQKVLNLTKGGKSFSAALRGTEKPPCVLVSLAVKVLQKNSLGCLLGFSPKSGTGKTSFS